MSDTTRAADLLSRFRENHKDTLTDEVISKLTSNIEKVNVYESAEDSLDDTDTYSKKNIISSIQQAYQSGGASAVTEVTNKYAEKITENQTAMTTAQKKWMIILLFLHLLRWIRLHRIIQQLWLHL